MPTIFDLVSSREIATYWETLRQNQPPFLGEMLFPDNKQLGMELKWLKGASGNPIVLKPSAFDVSAVLRPRIGFETVRTSMPFFKESMLIDETARQELNKVMATGNQNYIDLIVNKVFDDTATLLLGAASRREQMRMQALTTGMISISANGQDYDYDYGVPGEHKPTVSVSWSEVTADIMGDIQTWQDMIEDETGIRPTKAICSRKTWNYFLKNTSIRNAILGNDTAVSVSDSQLVRLLQERLGIQVAVYTKKFVDDNKKLTPYVPDDVLVLVPDGILGNTWFGTTPEESDLMSASIANVSITDTGVAITTMQRADPVNVETKVTMLCLPDFPTANQVIIADLTSED